MLLDCIAGNAVFLELYQGPKVKINSSSVAYIMMIF